MAENERNEMMEALGDYDACLQAPECTVDSNAEPQLEEATVNVAL